MAQITKKHIAAELLEREQKDEQVSMKIRWNGIGGRLIIWSGDVKLGEADIEKLATTYPERLDDMIKLYVRAKWGVDLDG